MNIVMSSGHGLHIRGASGFIDEVDEARKVVPVVTFYLHQLGVNTITYHDDISTTQDENLKRIVDFHNAQTRDLDVSIHFNAYTTTDEPMGTEVLYLTQAELASNVANAISKFSGLLNRGAKKRTDLYFLGHTEAPSILIEVCFCDSEADVGLYDEHFDLLCRAIAVTLAGGRHFKAPGENPFPEYQSDITASVFGGASDYNVSAYDETKVLDDHSLYVALPDRFEGERPRVRVFNKATGGMAIATIEDVGPWNIDDPYWDKGTRPQAEGGTDMSGRTTNGAGIDLSPALARELGIDGMGEVDWDFET